MTKVTISFTLDSERDRQILRYLEGLPRGGKSAAIREALAAQLGRGGVTLGDVFQAVKGIEHRLDNGTVLALAWAAGSGSQSSADEPADVAANLDARACKIGNRRKGGEKRCCCDGCYSRPRLGNGCWLSWKRPPDWP
jgi:hypothetical protein